jgi:hypothetical protein
MEEDKQLPKTSGGCEADVSPTKAGSESSPAAVLCMQLLAVVATKGNAELTEIVANETIITLLQSGYLQEAQILSNALLKIRQQILMERQQLEQRQTAALQQQMNLNINNNGLSVDQLKANSVTDIHDNNTVNFNDQDGGKR